MRTSAGVRAQTKANERQIVRAFRGQRAVTLRTARSLSDLGLHNSQSLQRMVAAAVLRRAGPERYFLDETAWASRRTMSGRSVWRVGLTLLFAATMVAWYLAG